MYTLHFTEAAEEDLLATLKYIADVLKAPEAAKNLLHEIEEQTELLTVSPLCHALVLDDYLCSKGIRYFLVKNYLLFYVIDEEVKKVSVIRILYARRDWSSILRDDNNSLGVKE